MGDPRAKDVIETQVMYGVMCLLKKKIIHSQFGVVFKFFLALLFLRGMFDTLYSLLNLY